MSIFETLRTANHNLFRNKVRTLLTIIAIFVGSFTIILSSGINAGVNAFVDEQVELVGGKDHIIIMPIGMVNTMSSMASSGPQEYNPTKTQEYITAEQLEKLKQIDGLDPDSFDTSIGTMLEYATSGHTDKKYQLTVAALPRAAFNIPLSAGRLPDNNSEQYEITLQPGYAQAFGFNSDEAALGQELQLVAVDNFTQEHKTFTAKIVGTEANGIVSTVSNSALVNRALQTALDDFTMQHYPPEYKSQYYMVTARFDLNRFTEDEIKAKLHEAGYIGNTMTDLMGSVHDFLDTIIIVFNVFGAIALLAAAIGIVNTLLMSVEERTREIGLDKALGMSSWRVFTEFATEAILLGFWGAVLGVLVAVSIGSGVNTFAHAPGGFLEIFPTFELFRFTLSNIVPIILIIILIALVAGTVPAIKAARKNPIDALRYE